MRQIRSMMGLAMVLLMTGCAWQNTTGKLLATTAQTVDAAMKSWAQYVKINSATDAQQAQVKTAYVKYQASMDAAVVAYEAAVTAKDQTLFSQASSALTASETVLLNLIKLFQSKGVTP